MDGTSFSIIRVACAVLEREGKILCAKRGNKKGNPGKWEFPGGKIEEGESPEQCLIREIREELDIEIEIRQPLPIVTYHYPDGNIVELFPFLASLSGGTITLKEHKKILWLEPENLLSLTWSKPDIPVINGLLSRKDK